MYTKLWRKREPYKRTTFLVGPLGRQFEPVVSLNGKLDQISFRHKIFRVKKFNLLIKLYERQHDDVVWRIKICQNYVKQKSNAIEPTAEH